MSGAAAVDEGEVARFSALAEQWWDPDGSFRPLHKINPVRVRYVRDALAERIGRNGADDSPLAGLAILDVGCGGGLLAEPLTRLGASVTGIDPSARNIAVAADHARAMGLRIDYRCASVEDLAAGDRRFDAVVALEVVEHVPDMAAFMAALTAVARPDAVLVLATLNRTAKAFALAIVGAEYVLGWLPRGTHRWGRFVRPSELSRALEQSGARLSALDGMSYDLLTAEWRLSRDLSVNYLATAEMAGRPARADRVGTRAKRPRAGPRECG